MHPGTFDTLLDASERLTDVFAQHAEELETMKLLNSQLRDALNITRQQEEEEEFKQARSRLRAHTLSHGPFVKRPPGGEGDEDVEEELCETIDGETGEVSDVSKERGGNDQDQDYIDDGEGPSISARQGDKTPPTSRPTTPTNSHIRSPSTLIPSDPTPLHTYNNALSMIRRLDDSTPDRISLHHTTSRNTPIGSRAISPRPSLQELRVGTPLSPSSSVVSSSTLSTLSGSSVPNPGGNSSDESVPVDSRRQNSDGGGSLTGRLTFSEPARIRGEDKKSASD